MPHAERLGEFSAGHRRGPGPVHDHFQVFEIASGQVRGIYDTRSGDDRSAVLVIVEYGNVHTLAQRLLDYAAFWRLDVFTVDAGETPLPTVHRHTNRQSTSKERVWTLVEIVEV